MPIEYSELTKQYVEALMREGDDFDPREWFTKIIAEKRRIERLHGSGQSLDPHSSSSARVFRHRSATPSSPSIPQDTATHHGQSKNGLGRRLADICDIWDEVQESRDRDSVYRYLQSIHDFVQAHRGKRKRRHLLRRAYAFAGLAYDEHVNPFAALVRCTTGGQVDRKQISKYARALMYVAQCNRPRMSAKRFMRFMKRAGGINGCAGRVRTSNTGDHKRSR
jgi:hypothetical protein